MDREHYDSQFVLLIGDLFRNIRKILDMAVSDFNLTRLEWLILGQLYYREDGMSQLRLLKLVEVDPAQLTRALDKLEKQGFLHKTIDKQDKRIRRIYLQAGSQKITEHMDSALKAVHQYIFENTPEAQANDFLEKMGDINKKLHLYKLSLLETQFG